jgi:hypothetical protein
VSKTQTLPKDHAMIPSLLQLLCMALSARHAYDVSSQDKVSQCSVHWANRLRRIHLISLCICISVDAACADHLMIAEFEEASLAV